MCRKTVFSADCRLECAGVQGCLEATVTQVTHIKIGTQAGLRPLKDSNTLQRTAQLQQTQVLRDGEGGLPVLGRACFEPNNPANRFEVERARCFRPHS